MNVEGDFADHSAHTAHENDSLLLIACKVHERAIEIDGLLSDLPQGSAPAAQQQVATQARKLLDRVCLMQPADTAPADPPNEDVQFNSGPCPDPPFGFNHSSDAAAFDDDINAAIESMTVAEVTAWKAYESSVNPW